MKRILFCLFVALVHINQLSALENISLNGFKALCEGNLQKETIIVRNNNWTAYTYKFGSEKVKIKLPVKPSELTEEGVFYVISDAGERGYIFMGLKPPISGANADAVFSTYLSNIEWDVVSATYTKSNGYPVMDLVAKDGFLYNSQRIIVTKKNVYALITTYIEGDSSNDHAFFVESCKIRK